MAYETAIIIFISAMAFLFIYLSVNLTKEHKLLAIILLLFVFPLFLLGAGAVNDIVDLGVANVTAFRWSYDEEGNKVHFDGNVMIGGADGYSSDGITLWGTGNNKGSGYFAQDLLVDGEMVLVEGASVNGTEVSFIDAIFDKGNSSNRFRDAYFSGNYYGNGTVQATTFYGSGAGLTELSTDTNATTECGNTQLLRGDGSCVEESGLGGTDLTNVAFINNSNTFTPDQYFSGNVGIGTTSPTSLLYVDGTANITGGSGQSGLVVDSGGRVLIGGIGGSNGDLFVKGSVGFGHTNPADFSADFNRLIVGDGVGNEGMVIWSAATGKSTLAFNDVATISGGIDYDHNTDDFNITALDSIKFETGTNAGDDFIVNTNSLVVEGDNGNVGIGTTSPATPFEVVGTMTGDDITLSSDITARRYNFVNQATAVLTGFTAPRLYATSTGGSFPFNEAGHLIISPRTSGADRDIYFMTDSASTDFAMVIQEEGNVGIGTTSPTTALEVSNAGLTQIAIDSLATTNDVALELKLAGTVMGRMRIDDDDSDKLQIFTASTATQGLTIDQSGNVGIGTTDPLGPVHIHQGSLAAYDPDDPATWATLKVSQADSAGGDASGGIRFQSVTDAHAAPGIAGVFGSGGSGTGHLVFITAEGNADYERMRIDSSGNVGIGTTSPQSPLEIEFSNSAVGSYTGLAIYNGNPTQRVAGTEYGAGIGFYFDNAADDGEKNLGAAIYSKKTNAWSSAAHTNKNANLMFYILNQNSSVPGMEIDWNRNVTVYGNLYAPTRSGGAIDIAELIYSEGTLPVAGDVLVASSNQTVSLSNKPYDTKVVGIVSTKPHLSMGSEYGSPTSVELALAGRVPVKVTLENGPIEVGDLLTTSSTPGYAMKCNIETQEQKLMCMGTILGKALEAFDETSEHETVMTLITLQ